MRGERHKVRGELSRNALWGSEEDNLGTLDEGNDVRAPPGARGRGCRSQGP